MFHSAAANGTFATRALSTHATAATALPNYATMTVINGPWQVTPKRADQGLIADIEEEEKEQDLGKVR